MAEPETLVAPPRDTTEFGTLTLAAMLERVAARFPDREALVFDDPFVDGETVRWSYAGLREEARRVARALLATGIGKGARVGILMSNRPEAVASLFGAAHVGAIATPLSTFSPKPELEFLLGHSDVSVLLTQTTMGKRRFADDIVDLCPSASSGDVVHDPAFAYLREVIALGPVEEAAGLRSWESFLSNGDDVDDSLLDSVSAQVHPSDLGVVIYSSGTTDRPKGVLHNQRAVTLQCWLQAELFGRDADTRVWCALPLFWSAGLNMAMGATVAAGGCWVTQEGFDAGESLKLMERERVTEPHALPHQARALEEHPDWATTDLSSCTKVFGKSVFTRHPTVVGDTAWNMPIGYGSSEMCSFATGLPWTTPREVFGKGSYGRLMPGNELRVVDPESGRVLGASEEGELALRGPTLMEHYVKRTRAECIDPDGFYHTGDFGSYDDEGLVYFSGRHTDMIKTGGANVSPAEIEVQLQAFEPVKLAHAIGIPDERRDEIVVLCVELKDGASADEREITDFLRARLAGYKVPRRVVFFAEGEIPMIGSGTKVDKDQLVDVVTERLGSDR